MTQCPEACPVSWQNRLQRVLSQLLSLTTADAGWTAVREQARMASAAHRRKARFMVFPPYWFPRAHPPIPQVRAETRDAPGGGARSSHEVRVCERLEGL